ncbi:MAG: ROK family protein, partial [Humibacter sp.]
SQPTVFATLANLEQAGLVRPSGQSEEQTGRPALVFEANPAAGTVLAVDLGRDQVRIVIADLLGRQLSRHDQANGARSAKSLVAAVARGAEQAAASADLDLADITCAVIGSPGVYRAQSGDIVYAAQMPGWQNPRLAVLLDEQLGVPFIIENDVNLAALSEYSEGAGAGMNPFAYLHIGTGVGMGVVIDGELYRGASGAAGEVGFLPLLGAPGAVPHDLGRGMLEEQLGIDAVVGYAKEEGLAGPLTPAKVYAAALGGSEPAIRAVRRQGEALARLLATIAATLDPESIVVGGELGQQLEVFGEQLMSRVAELTPLHPRLAPSMLGSDATIRGAVTRGVAMARASVFTARLSPDEAPADDGEAASKIS